MRFSMSFSNKVHWFFMNDITVILACDQNEQTSNVKIFSTRQDNSFKIVREKWEKRYSADFLV